MSNFDFLKVHSQALVSLGATAEKIFPHDLASCVAKMRLLAEAIAKVMANRLGIQLLQPTQAELLRRLREARAADTAAKPRRGRKAAAS